MLQAAVESGVSTLEEQLDIVVNLERSLVSDSRVGDLSSADRLNKYERSQAIHGLIGSMQSFQSMNGIIGEIAILYPKQEIELSTSNEYSRKACAFTERQKGDTARRLVYADGDVSLELWYPLTRCIDKDYIPDYGVRVTLSKSYLDELLNMPAIDEKEGGFSVLLTREGLRRLPETGEEPGEPSLMASWLNVWEEEGSPGSFCGKGRYQGESCYFVSESIPAYGITLVAYRRGGWPDSSVISALAVMGGVILLVGVVFLLMLYQTNRSVNKPLQKVVHAFESVQQGNLDVRISHGYNDEFQYIYSAFNSTVEHIQELIENVREQGRFLKNAELIQLQSQINPHFLYNSFYLIRIMAKNESYEQIDRFVTLLAKYYRFLSREADLYIPLSREAEHMENYMNIQQMRFGDKITVQTGELPAEAAEFSVPKLILQPLVENAYQYGMASILQDGRIAVSYEIRDGFLFIAVEDNGSGLDEETLLRMRESLRDCSGGAEHALSNIKRRIVLAFGENSGLSMERSGLGGLKAVLKLDLSVEL